MSFKRFTQIIFVIMLLLMRGVGNVWSQVTADDIIIQVMPSEKEGKGSVTDDTYGSVSASVGGLTEGHYHVTLTVTPKSGYRTRTALITAEKMIAPNQLSARRRALGIGTLTVTGPGSDDSWKEGDGATGYDYTFDIPSEFHGAYVTVTFVEIPGAVDPIQISTLSELQGISSISSSGSYVLTADIDASSLNVSLSEFTGTLDGKYHTIYNLKHPLFSSTDGAIIRNLNFEGVNITTGDNDDDAGVITSKAKGATRIYNCGILPSYTNFDTDVNVSGFSGSSIGSSSSRYVGGLVGFLDGTSRVINCFSYANITGGNKVGGIVGYNNVATNALAAGNIKTMVMNCMFYGDITGGTDKAPIYNGQNIANKVVVNNNVKTAQGVSNFNYFWEGASYVKSINTYNCALSAETRYLQRFEFFRHLLNSNRELAAWWVDGQKGDMAKWVLDKSVAPFPILKKQGYYPSVVNHIAAKTSSSDNSSIVDYKASTAPETPETQKTLSVELSGTGITTTSLTLPITDKDPDNFNFNYHTVQLPYFNDVGSGNYTNGHVVTGWEVTVSGGTHSYTEGANGSATVNQTTGVITLSTPYNFADRKSTGKDDYNTSGRIFSQGAYFDVPEGVSSISIKPHWANAVFIADASLDVVYDQNMANAYNVPSVGDGVRYTNGQSYTFTTKGGNITLPVYTKLGGNDGALKALFPSDPTGTVYDNALVLVGNFHSLALSSDADNLPYTIMSADFNHDNEPDNSYILRFNDRKRVHPVRIDFLDAIGLGMAQKSTEGQGTYNFGIMQPLGWFESTNTSLFRVTQFEYDRNPRSSAPMILLGGVIEQWVTVAETSGNVTAANAVDYYHVGSNVWFKEFHIGAHQDRQQFISPHPPISVTGGDFDVFYLTGLYNTPKNNYEDNAECYINGGRFGKVAGTGMQGLGKAGGAGVSGGPSETGNIIWQIDHADIDEFYAGGINAAHIATGNIWTVISNSRVDQFCGGPKFGNMTSTKTVVTNATNCTFRTFFGAGFGGNSYNREYPTNKYDNYNYSWDNWLKTVYKKEYKADFKGVSTRIDYQFIPKSDNDKNVARLFVDYISFSLATTHNVTSILTDCTITTKKLGRLKLFDQCLGNFYGGGSLGMVDGPVKSTLTNCIVEGNVFGGGYSATLPSVDVMANSFRRQPSYDTSTGAYTEAILPTTETYTWEHRDMENTTAIDTEKKILYTKEDLTGLGAVTGNVTLTIDGNTTLTNGKRMSVAKSVYGGGEESGVVGNIEVTVTGGTIGTVNKFGAEYGNIYGGGKGKEDDVTAGLVKGNTTISISGSPAILHNVYGGGAYGSVGDFNYDATTGMPTSLKTANTGITNVNITGGTFGTNGHENGMIFGSSRGDVGAPGGIHDKLAWVYDANVTIGTQSNEPSMTNPSIAGSVYGSGENGHTFHDATVTIHSGKIGITDTNIDGGAAYEYRGNVYGSGCGTDKYDSDSDGTEDTYNPLAGVVRGQTTVTIDGGHVVRNVYGAGAMGSVGGGSGNSSGKTNVTITGKAQIGVDGEGNGNVYGAARGDQSVNEEDYATVSSTTLEVSGDADIKGSVFGGGSLGLVKEDTHVTISGGSVHQSVYGGGSEANVKGNTNVSMTDGYIFNGIFGGGLSGSVGTFTRSWEAADVNIFGHTHTPHTGCIGKPVSCAGGTGKCTIVVSGGQIGPIEVATEGMNRKDAEDHGDPVPEGWVWGAGRGLVEDPETHPDTHFTAYVNETDVTIKDNAFVLESIIGGGEFGRVLGDTNVKIEGGQIGVGYNQTEGDKPKRYDDEQFVNPSETPITNENALAPCSHYPYGKTVEGKTVYETYDPYADEYIRTRGSLPEGFVGGSTDAPSDGRTWIGCVFGGGSGYFPYKTTDSSGNITDYGWVESAGWVEGDANLTISGGHILSNVYGANEYTTVQGKSKVTMTDGTIGVPRTQEQIAADPKIGHLFGGGKGDPRPYFNNKTNAGSVEVSVSGGIIYGSVFGGGESGTVKDSVKVSITGGVILSDVYGGGALADTQTSNWNASANNGTGGWATNKTSASSTTTVRLTGGTILGEAYGGGLGEAGSPAYVYGDVLLDLNGTTSSGETGAAINNTAKGCAVGQVFGCNNVNGSPKGDVMVHVYATQNAAATQIANTAAVEASGDNPAVPAVENAKVEGQYDVSAVYGGGNMAAYVPVTPNTSTTSEANGSRTQVIIEGCDKTSIETVYGGGNAAAVPETNVTILSAYEIGSVFGGGNGKDKILINNQLTDNPGADVGTLDQGESRFGTGNANSLLKGGHIHEAYGGSNTKGIVKGSLNQTSDPDTGEGACELVLDKIVGAGKYADIDGDVNMTLSCQPSSKVPLLFAGADEANVNGNITLNITNGHFGSVFGGNNLGGAVKGKITVNVEETGCQPIIIDNLYLGGNEAAYSVYGYYESGDVHEVTGKKILKPRTAEMHAITDPKADGYKAPVANPTADATHTFPYAQPELNIISCTYIGNVFGGGLGAPATMYASPSVNINMVKGDYGDDTTIGVPAMMTAKGLPSSDNTNHLGIIENVYGGGDAAPVIGETHVNIGTESTVGNSQTVLGAYITGNVYGGGKLANVGEMDADIDQITAQGRTFVNIGAKKTTVNNQEDTLAVAAGKGVTIKGNVYGGGKGEAKTFKCEKAIVAGSTNVMIGNGTVKGTVYGGGQLGRVETGTTVTIGVGDGDATGTPDSEPYINGNVYGAGAGVNTHGYAALVRGISEVTIQGNAKVDSCVYGGGQIASVGRYKVKKGYKDPSDAPDDVEIGMPYTLADSESKCIVTVKGYAEIGPDNMQMKAEGGPDDTGYVFGAGKGVLPYEGYAENEDPVRWTIDDNDQYVQEVYTSDKEDLYLKYVGTLALATETEVTIGGHAFVKGSVYGGSENGHVQHNTNVKIEDHCQIGNGWNTTTNTGVNTRYNEALFVNPATATAQDIETAAASIYECAHWDYANPYTPYDKNGAAGGGATTAKDGHTFYGNVFGGGSGYYPYKSRLNKDNDGNYIFEWLRTAGRVVGNTNVIITGGHILTSVYGGCELTDVGNGVSVESNKGQCFVKMSGGTLGVPRTLAQIAAHPVTCYLFGAGKGDQRVHFNQWTNVGKVRVEINDSISQPIIYGSVFGGGEDGHVLGDVNIDIKKKNSNDPVIGTWGTSYVDGNVFGGGRGFGGDALTAGVVSGNVNINISGGKMLGSIYGGGRLGSVGTYLVPSDKTQKYGQFIPDGKQQTINEVTIGNGDVVVSDTTGVTHGHVTINISGGTIGNSYEYAYYAPGTTIDKTTNHIPYTEFDATSNRLTHTKGGNVFAGAMGRLYGLNGRTVLPHWLDLGKVKSTKLTVSDSAVIKSSIYGGGELGWTSGTHKTSDNKDVSTEISITGGTIGSEIKDNNNVVQYTYGSVFGGGYGNATEMLTDANSKNTYPKFQAGRVMNSTAVTMSSGTVKASVYGGGELANVGYGFYSYSQDGLGETAITQASDAANTYVTVSGGIIGKAPTIAQTGNTYFGGATMGNVYGGGSGNKTISRCGLVLGNTNVNISDTTRIYHNIYGGGAYGSVGDYEYTTGTDDPNYPDIVKVFGINGLHTSGTGTANVTITGGTIGYDGKDNGMVFGSSRGDVQGEDSRDDYMAWVNDAYVTIGTSSSTTGPHIRGSVYGSGENGHVFNNTYVNIYSGTIGIDNANTSVEGYTVTSSGTTYNGPEYPSRGNVYGGGCGTDTYTKNDKEYFNPTAGIVKGNTNVTMTGGHVVRTVYGGGSMGSVGTFTSDADSNNDIQDGKPISCATNTGKCTVEISGGKIGPTSMSMPNYYGNVFGAGRGEMHDPADYPNLETSAYFNETDVTITDTAFVKGSVYGGAESGHVLNDTKVVIDGNCQIGCGYDGSTNGAGDLNRVYTAAEWAYDVTTDNTKFLYECNSWPYQAPYTPYDKFADDDGEYSDGSSADNAHSTGTDGHTFYGNVFGGGSGSTPYAPGKWLPTAGWVEGNTSVEIKGGHILTSVYGGNEMSDVGAGGVRKMTDLANETADMFYDITKSGGKCTVKMSGGTLGVPRTLDQIAAHPLTCYLFGAGKGDQRIFFNKTTNVKEAEVEVSGGRIYGSVFGGGEDGHVMKNVTMTIKDNAYIGTWGTSYVEGNIFGGGRGFSGEALTAGNVGGCVEINIQGGTMLGSVYGGGRLGSVGYGLYLVDEVVGSDIPYGVMRPNNVDDRGNAVSNFNRGYITINISGGIIGNNIEYQANPSATDKQKMPTTTFDSQNHLLYTRGGNVFAGCMGRLYSLENELLPLWPKLGRCKQTTLNITGGTIKSNVYGGAELGVVEQNTSVNITGGQVGTRVGTGSGAYYYGSVFGSGKGSNDNITYPSATPVAERIPISEAGTTGDSVTVHLNKDVAANAKGGIVRKVFGCNDMNGTPKGDVLVHIHATQNEGTDNIATKVESGYDVDYVFGGGNNADYVPTVSGAKQRTEVIIEGCDLTSIEEVYGGGFGAATPGTKVEVRGTQIINNLFGGGYGAGDNNPGANVGYRTVGKTAYANGEGKAVVQLMAGTVNNVFGGSNTNGDIRGGSSITNVPTEWTQGDGQYAACCENLKVGEIYGGGKSAPMEGGAEIVLGCMPDDWIGEIYAGAQAADVGNDVSLTLTSGKFERVFGGNNVSGTIDGSIEVNIEECPTCDTPIIIGELYGGGNMASYTVPASYTADDPEYKSPRVNVRSFTSIGSIYGGGYGSSATVNGNPMVNINVGMVKGGGQAFAGADKAGDLNVTLYPHVQNKIGVIGNVFGGGNAAPVNGNTYVNIGTQEYEVLAGVIVGETDVSDYYTRSGDGPSYTYTKASVSAGTATEDNKAIADVVYYMPVVGADIRGNVFGGGNNAAVTGDTNVQIGKKAGGS